MAGEKIVNVIVKNPYGDIIYVEAMKCDKKGVKSFEDIRVTIQKRLKWPATIMLGYDLGTQQSLLVYKAQNENGKIDWSLNFNDIDLLSAFCATAGTPVNVVSICFKRDIGLGAAGIGDVLEFVEVVKLLLCAFFIIHTYIFPFRVLSKKYGVDESYIRDTIKRSKSWDIGFISTEDFRYKTVVERSVMNKMRYKRIGEKWVSMTRRPFKFPHDIFRQT